jgi:hypothetical protein
MSDKPQSPTTAAPAGQPGVVISPQTSSDKTAETASPVPVSPQQTPLNPEAPWQFTQEDSTRPTAPNNVETPTDTTTTPPEQEISWKASEFVTHPKGVGWYAVLFLGGALLAVVANLLTHDIVSVVVIGLLTILSALLAAKKPRTLAYHLGEHQLQIGPKIFSYGDFKSYAVVDEDAFASIALMPLRRFMPVITMYYDPKDEEKILAILNLHLPLEQNADDPLDRFLRRVHF